MQKRKRIFMGIVAVVLCLTLVSSCLVSGVFAKYTTKKAGSFTIGFEKFGVTVNMSVPDKLSTQHGATVILPDEDDPLVQAGVYTIEFQNLKICPGDDLSDLVKVSFEGSANVDLQVKWIINMSYSNLNLTVPVGVGGITTSNTYLPFEFNCHVYDGDTLITKFLTGSDWRTGDDTGATNRAQNIAKNLGSALDFTQHSTQKNCAYKTFSPTNPIVFHLEGNAFDAEQKAKDIDTFEMGLLWDFETNDTYNAIDTYIAETNPNASINISYTVKVEQIKKPVT